MPKPYDKVFLIVLDGFGLADPGPGNAILGSGAPFLNELVAQYPSMSLSAAGLVVGLPWGQPGNSEVGHAALGTGRIIVQDLAHINHEIRTKNFFKNKVFVDAAKHCKEHDSALHLMGCTSPGGIHAHTDHLIALLEFAKQQKLPKVFIHFITDGQDMPPQDAVNVLKTLEKPLKKAGAEVASVSGRSFAMDRVLNWNLTEQVWHAVVLGDAPAIEGPQAYLEAAYAGGETDYSVAPATVVRDGLPIGAVQDNDAILFFDFRNDRVRQLVTPFVLGEEFDGFDRVRMPQNLYVGTMTKYTEAFVVPVAYPAWELEQTLGQIISEQGVTQYRIAEKEKEAHVTSFFNGGRINAFPAEERLIASSRQMRGDEYVKHPEMSAQKILETVLEKKDDPHARLYVINFANPDMIGHTGNLKAATRAVSITDDAVKRLIQGIQDVPNHAVIITADHGNAEELIDPLTGQEDTQHSARNVPGIFIAPEWKNTGSQESLEMLAQQAPVGTLVDIAPTVLTLLGIPIPKEMTGSPLIQ